MVDDKVEAEPEELTEHSVQIRCGNEECGYGLLTLLKIKERIEGRFLELFCSKCGCVQEMPVVPTNVKIINKTYINKPKPKTKIKKANIKKW